MKCTHYSAGSEPLLVKNKKAFGGNRTLLLMALSFMVLILTGVGRFTGSVAETIVADAQLEQNESKAFKIIKDFNEAIPKVGWEGEILFGKKTPDGGFLVVGDGAFWGFLHAAPEGADHAIPPEVKECLPPVFKQETGITDSKWKCVLTPIKQGNTYVHVKMFGYPEVKLLELDQDNHCQIEWLTPSPPWSVAPMHDDKLQNNALEKGRRDAVLSRCSLLFILKGRDIMSTITATNILTFKKVIEKLMNDPQLKQYCVAEFFRLEIDIPSLNGCFGKTKSVYDYLVPVSATPEATRQRLLDKAMKKLADNRKEPISLEALKQEWKTKGWDDSLVLMPKISWQTNVGIPFAALDPKDLAPKNCKDPAANCKKIHHLLFGHKSNLLNGLDPETQIKPLINLMDAPEFQSALSGIENPPGELLLSLSRSFITQLAEETVVMRGTRSGCPEGGNCKQAFNWLSKFCYIGMQRWDVVQTAVVTLLQNSNNSELKGFLKSKSLTNSDGSIVTTRKTNCKVVLGKWDIPFAKFPGTDVIYGVMEARWDAPDAESVNMKLSALSHQDSTEVDAAGEARFDSFLAAITKTFNDIISIQYHKYKYWDHAHVDNKNGCNHLNRVEYKMGEYDWSNEAKFKSSVDLENKVLLPPPDKCPQEA